jgi:TonB family protein
MSRLEKKCLLASTVMHGFLLLLVAFGAAFFLPTRKAQDLPRLRVVPSFLVDNALAGGGGNPKLPRTDDIQKGETLTPQPAPAPAEKPKPPQPPPPAPKPAKAVTPVEIPKRTEATIKKPAKPVEVAKPSPNATKPPEPTLKPIVRGADTKAKEKAEAEAREAARAEAAYRSQIAKALGKTASGLREGFASGTKVEVGGPGGAAYADYRQFVQAIYDEAWLLPQDTSDDGAAIVSVTIGRSGHVLSSRIVRPSGNSALDRSVQRALDKVKFVRPFPEGSKDEQRTFTIEFNVKEKRLLG